MNAVRTPVIQTSPLHVERNGQRIRFRSGSEKCSVRCVNVHAARFVTETVPVIDRRPGERLKTYVNRLLEVAIARYRDQLNHLERLEERAEAAKWQAEKRVRGSRRST